MYGDMRNDLPENCLATLTSTGELIVIQQGEKGYHHSEWDTGDSRENQKIADHYNQEMRNQSRTDRGYADRLYVRFSCAGGQSAGFL